MKDRGLELIAVNRGDSEETIRKYVQEGKFTFPIVMGGKGEQYTLGKAYGVRAYPTNYLLDSEGKVAWRGVGFSPATEKTLRDAIEKLGVK